MAHTACRDKAAKASIRHASHKLPRWPFTGLVDALSIRINRSHRQAARIGQSGGTEPYETSAPYRAQPGVTSYAKPKSTTMPAATTRAARAASISPRRQSKLYDNP